MNFSEDRRAFKRIPSAFQVEAQAGGQEMTAVAIDVSAGGLGLELNRIVPAGAMLRLSFTLANKELGSYREKRRRFDLNGKLLHCAPAGHDGYRAGIAFEELTGEDLSFIRQCVVDRLPKELWM